MSGLIFGGFIVLMLLGIPIAAAIGLPLMVGAVTGDAFSMSYLIRAALAALDSFPILAVPMFILAGEIMGAGGISKSLFDFANSLVGRMTGGVAMATIFTCMLFGAISGSAQATFAAVGTFMIPLMARQGYNKEFVTGVTASSGGLGVLIPPSLPLVMYGISASVSIGTMFTAGILPGIISGLALMVYVYIYCKRHPIDMSKMSEADQPKPVLTALKDGFWALLSPVIILGGIYTGIFTPTEAAAVSVVYSILIGKFVYKTLRFRDLPKILLNAAAINAPVLFIVVWATTLGRVLSLIQFPAMMANFILSLTSSKFLILVCINIILIIAGMFMETLCSIVILTPILLPIAIGLNIDPVHFGVIMVANLAIGFVTPPIGINLYTAASLTGIPFSRVARSCVGPIIALLIALVLIIAIPGLSLFLPSLMG